MRIPRRVRQAVGLVPELPFGMNEGTVCPLGCDPQRTVTAISKPGNKHERRFVPVYYKRPAQERLTEFQRQDNILVS